MTEKEITAEELLDAVVAAHGAGERRPQQEVMVKTIDNALKNSENAVVQAGTGVGKSLGYLIPLVADGRRAVVSTATKQLSEQIAHIDIPFLTEVYKKETGQELNTSILKGRANYACHLKINKLEGFELSGTEQMGLDDVAGLNDNDADATNEDYFHASVVGRARIKSAQARRVIDYIKEHPETTGDRTELPNVHDETWKDLSSTTNQCVGASTCPFASSCFSEKAREEAYKAQLVITNHHLVATDLVDPDEVEESDSLESRLEWMKLGARDVVVFDEAHELDGALTSSWGMELSHTTLRDFIKLAKTKIKTGKAREALTNLSGIADTLETLLDNEPDPRRVTEWSSRYSSCFGNIALELQTVLTSAMNNVKENTEIIRSLENIIQDVAFLVKVDDPEIVIWIHKDFEKRMIMGAPLRVGPELMKRLNASQTQMIATSATISVDGGFSIAERNWALEESTYPNTSIDVGTPFDYPRQGILYIPKEEDFPAPVGADRKEHSEAILDSYLEFVKAAGGRTLALSSTSSGARRIAEHLRNHVDTPVISQFDGPAGVVTQQFLEDEQSTLVATMGMWHGLNVPGKSLSVVLIDKIPFAPFNDPLLVAQQKYVEDHGGNGFMQVYVAQATTMLAQGVGRLIRHTQDKGLVAIFDTRLKTKRYGNAIIKSLPNMWMTQEKDIALTAIKRLLDS